MILIILFIFGILFWIALFVAMYQQKEEKKQREEEKRYKQEVLLALQNRQSKNGD